MKPFITVADLIQVIDASNRDAENWIARLDLYTKYHQPARGKPRLLTRDNALELSFLAGLVRGGATPRQAALFAASFVRSAQPGDPYRREWFVFPAKNLQTGFGVGDEVNLATIQKDFQTAKGVNTTTLSFLHVGEIIRRVDKLFEGD